MEPKKTRGKRKCKEIHARSLEERVEVQFVKRVAVGPTAKVVSDLSLFLGTIARNPSFCPLDYTNWKAMPKSNKDRILEYVESKFIIPEEGKDWVLIGIREAWKRYKSNIKKKHFTPYENMEDMLKNCPENIDIDVFKKLISFWSLPTIKKASLMNTENRKRQKWMHRMGPVNFAIVRNQMSNNGEEVTQAKLFIATRTGNKGKELDPETKTVIDELHNRIEISGEDSTEAFQAVLGKEPYGRVRCFGRGVTKTSLKIDAAVDSANRKNEQKIASLETEVADLKKIVAAIVQNNNIPGINLETLAFLRGSPPDANSAPNNDRNGNPGSSASTHVPE